MALNKTLISALLIPFLFLSSCKVDSNKRPETKKQFNISTSIKNFNEKTSPPKDSPQFNLEYIESAKRNNQYLEECIKNNPRLHDSQYLMGKLNFFLKNSEHTYVKKDTDNTIFYDVSELSLNQLQRVYLIIKSLEDSSFIQEIGKEIEEDVKDKYAEHGGIILFDKKRVHLKSIESCLVKDTIYNGFYGPSEESFFTSNLGSFHIHAEDYTEIDYAHPSSRDLITSYFSTHITNEAHDFLITSLRKGTFNLDYYGGHKAENPITKILDLGNYNYDTSEVEENSSKIFK
jgi:hypothetical protein